MHTVNQKAINKKLNISIVKSVRDMTESLKKESNEMHKNRKKEKKITEK